MKKILSSMMMIAALSGPLTQSMEANAAPAAETIADATTHQRVEIKVQSRTETSGGIVVHYSMNERKFQLTGTSGSSSTTMRIFENGRQLLEVVGNPSNSGTGTLKNHRGVVYSAEQMRKDPSLAAEFDSLALGTLDIDIAKLILVGNTTVPNPCAAHPIMWVACGIGAYIYFCVKDCDGNVCTASGGCGDD